MTTPRWQEQQSELSDTYFYSPANSAHANEFPYPIAIHILAKVHVPHSPFRVAFLKGEFSNPVLMGVEGFHGSAAIPQIEDEDFSSCGTDCERDAVRHEI